jgi:hypothetical protein
MKPILINLNWAKECYMNLNISKNSKKTRGNLMNLLVLPNLIEPITSSKLDLSPPHGS